MDNYKSKESLSRVVVRPYLIQMGKKVVQHIKIQLIRLKRQMLMVKFNMNESMILLMDINREDMQMLWKL